MKHFSNEMGTYLKLYSSFASNVNDDGDAWEWAGRTVVPVVVSRNAIGWSNTNRSSLYRCLLIASPVIPSPSIISKIFARSLLSSLLPLVLLLLLSATLAVRTCRQCDNRIRESRPYIRPPLSNRLTFDIALADTITLLFNSTSETSMTQPTEHELILEEIMTLFLQTNTWNKKLRYFNVETNAQKSNFTN